MSTKLFSSARTSDTSVDISSMHLTATHHTGTTTGVWQWGLSPLYTTANKNWSETMCSWMSRPVCQHTRPLEDLVYFVGKRGLKHVLTPHLVNSFWYKTCKLLPISVLTKNGGNSVSEHNILSLHIMRGTDNSANIFLRNILGIYQLTSWYKRYL